MSKIKRKCGKCRKYANNDEQECCLWCGEWLPKQAIKMNERQYINGQFDCLNYTSIKDSDLRYEVSVCLEESGIGSVNVVAGEVVSTNPVED